MDELDHLGWVVHRSYEVEDVQFGVRTNSEAVGAWLDATFGNYRIDKETTPFLSVLVGGEDGQVGKRFHILYQESRALVKSLDLGRVGEALVAQFEHVATARRDDALYLDAALVQRDGVAALVPAILPPFLSTLGRRAIDSSKIELPLSNYVAIDLDTADVIPVEPSLDVPRDAIGELQKIVPSGDGTEPQPSSQPTRVDTICFLGVSEEPVTPVSPGRAAHNLSTQAVNLRELEGRALLTLGRLVDRARNVDIRAGGNKNALASLVAALSARD